jgi:hypothetical protein
MSDETKLKLLSGLVFVGILSVFVAIGVQWKGCHDAGGTFVRGAVWFQCID